MDKLRLEAPHDPSSFGSYVSSLLKLVRNDVEPGIVEAIRRARSRARVSRARGEGLLG